MQRHKRSLTYTHTHTHTHSNPGMKKVGRNFGGMFVGVGSIVRAKRFAPS